jgi:hypothetical protein
LYPRGHGSHFTALSLLYDPASQGKHLSIPGAGAKNPILQEVQLVTIPPSLNVPAGHSMGSSDGFMQYFPGGHSSQNVDPGGLNVPEGHSIGTE